MLSLILGGARGGKREKYHLPPQGTTAGAVYCRC